LTPDNYCSVSEFDPFTVYAYNDDAVPGFTMDEDVANAVARLTNGEQTASEDHLWSLMGAAIGANVVDLTGHDLWYGLGYVEQVLAETYGGQGVIHMSRLTATFLWEYLTVQGGKLVTKLGTPVISGAGYDNYIGDPPNNYKMFVSGPVVLYRGDIDTRENALDRSTNQTSIIAQRDYVLGWDCVAYGVEAPFVPVPK
jgi:hypothetical protein